MLDLNGVVTKTAKVHAASWKRLFDEFLESRAAGEGKSWERFEIGATLFLGDNLDWRKIMAVIFSVIGVLVINTSGKSIQASGIVELFRAACWFSGSLQRLSLHAVCKKSVG